MNKKNSTKIRKNILFFSYLKILIRAKWDYKKIKKKKFLLVDGDDNPFLKYYNKKDFNIIHRRGESINTRVLLKCILNFNLTALNYYRYFIKLADPKLIFTAFDYHPIFYKLSKLSGVKTFMLQKGTRNKNDLIMQNKNLIDKDKKKKFFVDYIFLYNKFVGNFYKKIIKGKYINIGHFENNCEKINFSQQKKEILFISNFKIDKNNKLQLNCENDDQVVYNLHKLAISKKIKFSILPKQTGNKKRLEFLFYKNLLKKNFIFVKKKNRNMFFVHIRL
jgi:surface carbohydrate biosynthesis protein